MSVDSVQFTLMYLLVPMWVMAGFIDWIFHRRSDIENTAGFKESLIHLLMFAEVGIPLMAAIFLEINALVIGLMTAAFLIHEATALWDVSYAVSKRWVSPGEQHVHSLLEMLPLMAMVMVSLMHEPQLLALFGLGGEPARFDVLLKAEPVPKGYIAGLITGALAFSVIPYLNELWRGIRSERSASGPRPGIPHESR